MQGILRSVFVVIGWTLVFAIPSDSETVWSTDFAAGASSSGYELKEASVVTDTATGQARVVADSLESDSEWHEFFQTTPQVRFEPGHTYHVSFRYEVIDPGSPETRFYSLLRSPTQGDKYGPFWLWTREAGGSGTIHRLFTVEEGEDWALIIGIRHRGKIAIDQVRVWRTEPDYPGRGLPIKPGSTRVFDLRRELADIRRAEGMEATWKDMLVVWCNEGAGEKIYNAEARRRFALQHTPDFVDWNPVGPMAKEFGVRTSRGGPEYQEFYSFEGPEIWEKRYEKFGDNGFQVSVEGTFIRDETWGEGGYFTCQLAPGWNGWFTRELIQQTSNQFGVCQDNISCAPFYRGYGCFCRWCLSGFNQWMKNRYTPQELSRFGIEDISQFSYHDRVMRHGLVGNHALEDPVTREYIKYQFAGHLEAWAEIVKKVKAAGQEKGLSRPVYGNQIGAFGMWPFAAAISQYCDIIEIEEVLAVEDTIPNWSLLYRMGLASSHHQRPVWVRGPVLDASQERMGLMSLAFWKVHLAQGLAAGGVRDISFGVNAPWTGDPDTLDYMDSEEIQKVWKEYADFCHENRATLTHRNSLARVALVYSLPGTLFRRYYPLNIDNDAYFRPFDETSRWLDANHIPHDCLIFGHTELFETDVKALDRYDALVLPNADALSDTQWELLARFAARGGLIVSGQDLGRLDENLNPRPDRGRPAFQPLGLTRNQALASRLRAVSGVSVKAPGSVVAHVWSSLGGKAIDVHLVSYAADLKENTFSPVPPVEVELEVPDGFRFGEARLLQMNQPASSLVFIRDGNRVRFTVPSFEGYAVVSLCDGSALDEANRQARQRRADDRDYVKQKALELDLY